MRGNSVHKITVMRDKNDFTFKAFQKRGKPAHGDDVKVVGWLIQKQHTRIGCKEFDQVNADLIPS